MIYKIEGIYNGRVMVNYDQHLAVIIIQNQLGNDQKNIFGANVQELYQDYKENMSDETDYETTVRFFSQNIDELV